GPGEQTAIQCRQSGNKRDSTSVVLVSRRPTDAGFNDGTVRLRAVGARAARFALELRAQPDPTIGSSAGLTPGRPRERIRALRALRPVVELQGMDVHDHQAHPRGP